jgi:heavy metal translocating P-type ATPase
VNVSWQEAGLVVLVLAGAPIAWRTVRDALSGRFATDIVATLAIVTSVVLRQPIAGLVIVLMRSGGELLEQFAARRASRALDELEEATPRTAHRMQAEIVEDIGADDVRPDDVLLIRPGELIPTDGVVVGGASSVDVSRVTGESIPVAAKAGVALLSGCINGDRPLHLRSTARASESQYARIVELVRTAQASKAPLQRLADRYAVWFTPFTLAVCALTLAVTGDWTRVLAVLVVATPCPLILAAPVAFVGGISHAARHGIIVRHGGALEAIASVDVAIFDKTGTLTIGHPAVSRIEALSPWDPRSVLRLAGAVEEGSGHSLARSIVTEAHRHNGASPAAALDVVETPGQGVVGRVGRHTVAVGSRSFVVEKGNLPEKEAARFGADGVVLRSHVVVDGKPAATIEFSDVVRPSSAKTIDRLRQQGFKQTLLLSGDQEAYVAQVAAQVGISSARGELLPQDKVDVVQRLKRTGHRVLMVGDGVNDAPALSAADVGIALARHGRGIASESADIVLLEDDIAGVAEAVHIGRKTMRIARQSILVGLGLSGVAMIFAAYGFIAPVMGAVIQEAIDVAVILNALRTSR